MYISKLNELCKLKSWSLPVYSNSKEGPDHNPFFTASVVVNGVTFSSVDKQSSSKLAINDAAQIAFIHLNESEHSSIEGSSDTSSCSDLQLSYKSQLQFIAQKRNLILPVYSSAMLGPPHNPRFKGKVLINGKSFDSPELCKSLKEADHAAAKVALLSLPTNGFQEEVEGVALYRNLLRVLVEKEGFGLPKYFTNMSGEAHRPTFVSTVNINDEIFRGTKANAKKLAVDSAAKVAYITLTQRKRSLGSGVDQPNSQLHLSQSSSFGTVNLYEKSLENVIEEPLKDSNGLTTINGAAYSDPHIEFSPSFPDEKRPLDNNLDGGGSLKATHPHTITPSFAADKRSTDQGSSLGADSSGLTTINEPIDLDPQIEFSPSFLDEWMSSGSSSVDADSNSLSANNEPADPDPHVKCSPSFLNEEKSLDLGLVYKSQLQFIVQRRNLTLPVYSSAMVGHPHNPHFRGKVTIDGKIFESPELCKTLKQADHAAAKVALLSFPTSGLQEEVEDVALYRNLLREFVEKEGFGLPKYCTEMSGEAHKPTFVSTVKINEEIFQGTKANTKKLAENRAAKVAYITLTQRRKCFVPDVAPYKSQLHLSQPSSLGATNLFSKSLGEVMTESLKGNIDKSNVDSNLDSENVFEALQVETFTPGFDDVNSSTDQGNSCRVSKPDSASSSAFSTTSFQDSALSSKSAKKKVVIFPRNSNITIPDSNNVLEIHNDDWVAMISPAPHVCE